MMTRSLNRAEQYLCALGHVMHDLRSAAGISQQELAEHAGVHRTYVSDVERGARNLTLGTVIRLAMVLDVSPSRLFRMVEDRTENAVVEAGSE